MFVVYIYCILVLSVLMSQYTYIVCLYWTYLCPGMYICISALDVLMLCTVGAYALAS